MSVFDVLRAKAAKARHVRAIRLLNARLRERDAELEKLLVSDLSQEELEVQAKRLQDEFDSWYLNSWVGA